MITEESILAFLKRIMDADVPQKGRFIEHNGVVYGEGDEFPADFRALLEKLADG